MHRSIMPLRSLMLTITLVAGCSSTNPGTVDGHTGDEVDSATDATGGTDGASDAPTARHLYPGAYASPTIVRDGATFHAYFAEDRFGGMHYNLPHASFTADGDWTVVGEALPH